MLQLPKVVGHRGAMAYAPENTLDSFREAHRRGATWVEIDVKLTQDGVPIVMHDSSLKRTTGVDRLASEMTAAELPPSVPTFEQAIACFGELGLGCNVEIKPCEGREAETARVTVATLRKLWPAKLPAPLLSSFKDASLAAAREAAPEFARALLIDEVKDDWQGRGVASALMPLLVEHRPPGVTYLLTEVSAHNPASLAMLRRVGPTRTHPSEPGVIDVEVDLSDGGVRHERPGPQERLHPALAVPHARCQPLPRRDRDRDRD